MAEFDEFGEGRFQHPEAFDACVHLQQLNNQAHRPHSGRSTVQRCARGFESSTFLSESQMQTKV